MVRSSQPGVVCHVIERTATRRPAFASVSDRIVYLEALRDALADGSIALHAYVLMGNHVHLVATPREAGSVIQVVSGLRRNYAAHLDARYGFQGLFWSAETQVEPLNWPRQVLDCMRYVEMNPVAAGLVGEPGDWRWSSHRWSGRGEPDLLLTPHAAWLALGRDAEERRRAWCASFTLPVPARAGAAGGQRGRSASRGRLPARSG